MSRDNIHADTAAELLLPALAPIGLVALYYDVADGGTFRMWTGIGTLSWGGYSWYGAGTLGSISAIEETIETRATGVELTLSGVGADVLEIALRAPWQGREARIYYAVMDDNNQLIGEPFQLFRGIMDLMTLTEGDKAEIKLQLESLDIDLGRNKSRRYTAEDQRGEYPGDAGCDQVAALQDKTFTWMRG